MMKRFSTVLLLLLLILACSNQYQTSSRKPRTVIYRGQKPAHVNMAERSKALNNSKIARPAIVEDDYQEIAPALKVTPVVTQKYIEDYKEIAMVEMQRYNIPASITLAQGILESGSGQARLARYGNNHFGIKCHASWSGKTMTHDDDAKSECFRRYKYAYESFEDHSQFLVGRTRYAALFELDPTDYEAWAHGLRKAGYATDPTYARKLIALIKQFNLHQYDTQVIAQSGGMKKNPNSTIAVAQKIDSTAEKEARKPVINPQVVKATPTKPTPKPTTPSQKAAPVLNTLPAQMTVPSAATTKAETIAQGYYQVQAGDTLYKISREQQVPVQQLMALNNFDDVASANLRIGQQIRLN